MTASALRRTLQAAKSSKNDEFYTQMNDVENELQHYDAHFAGKVVYLNCDDPRDSNFFRYFAINFERLGLAKLITSSYVGGDRGEAVTFEYTGGPLDLGNVPVEPLVGDGDFRSVECREMLREADVVVTNPPFSLFRDLVTLIIDHRKKFLLVGTTNVVSYKDFLPRLLAGQIWAGVTFNKAVGFVLPDRYEKWSHFDEAGRKIGKVPGVCWYTNMDHGARHDALVLTKVYDPARYPKYDTYDAIDVGRVVDIPVDYFGEMGVPITFLGKWDPEQFEILGRLASAGVTETNFGQPLVDGKCRYARLVIRRKAVPAALAG